MSSPSLSTVGGMLVPAGPYGWTVQLSCVLPSLSLIWSHGEAAPGINPAATFSYVFAKCFAGLAPEVAHQAIGKAPVKEQGEQQDGAAGSTARERSCCRRRYLLWHHWATLMEALPCLWMSFIPQVKLESCLIWFTKEESQLMSRRATEQCNRWR